LPHATPPRAAGQQSESLGLAPIEWKKRKSSAKCRSKAK
jgi:hypothetical protein